MAALWKLPLSWKSSWVKASKNTTDIFYHLKFCFSWVNICLIVLNLKLFSRVLKKIGFDSLFDFFFRFYFIFYFYFTLLYWFCHTSTWIRHGCTRIPNPEPPSHLPPQTIPLGHPSAPAPSTLYPTSNLDWRFVSYMILYMFPCHSPKSSYPLPPQRVQKTVLDTDV